MSISAAFHKNVSLLLQAVPASYDFKKHYKEGMFDKPNTAGFTYVSHYLLSIYNPDYFKKLIEWPIVCKKSEAKYRNDVKEFLNVISNDNPDIGFPSIVPSLLLSPGGTKFIKVMWKLSQVALREYIKRQSDHEVLFAPKRGTAEELTESLIMNIINNTNDNNSKIYEDLLKSEEEAKKYALEEKEKIIKTQKEIFEELEIIASLSAEAPVHPSVQKRLLDFDDEEVIQMWKEDLRNSMTYFKNKVQILKDTEDICKTVFSIASNIISESTVLNANFLQKIDIYSISELPFPKIKVLAQHIYTNGNFNLMSYFLLLNTMTEYCGQYISANGFLDFYDCYSQLEASCSDLKRMSEFLCELHSKMVQFSAEVQPKSDLPTIVQYDPNESLITGSELKNVMFMPSPPIQFNSDNNGRTEIHNRLKLTPVEGVHKQLFLRYNQNKDGPSLNASRVRQNLTVTRINFDDTISSEIVDRKSPGRRFLPPKTIWSTCKPAGKYSRLFSNRATQPTNKAANCSMMSMPCSSKANSTILNNVGDGNNAELTIDMTMKSFFSYSSDTSVVEKKSTPKKMNRFFDIPETSADANKQYLCLTEEIEVKFHKPCQPVASPNKCDKPKGRRRSITDLVERYKRVMEKSTSSVSKLESVFDTNISEET